ncbi:DUF5689 domain-containing protein [Pedobacter xixiisoli]|uniref:DUF5689 domain-containing protein n=1 Tax=Pedobacter xixiisoli TaxID=1476464 RepID=A0A285ZRP3_9SPHI|nr:DUF5689 domain-containing protein [Pedobacter xixiisoli]SOD12318.1 hypothetical protein SAMN06297358_0605 [Pedobacter xixiisoli]
MKYINITLLTIIISAIIFSSCKKNINQSEGVVNSFAALHVLKSAYKGSEITLSAKDLAGANLVGGVVISNLSGKNFPEAGLIIQNSDRGLTRGILIGVTGGTIPFATGDSVVVDVSGAVLGKVSSSLQLKNISLDKIRKVSSGNSVLVKSVSLGEMVTNFATYENTLVSIVADTKPLPEAGETYSGNKTLDDGSGSTISLFTQNNAAFQGNSLPASATYKVIPIYGNATGGYGDVKQVRIRTIADVSNASGPIYPNWPESFESPNYLVKGSYNMNTPAIPNNNVDLKTGNWKLEQAILGFTDGRDRFNAPGLQCIRMQQNLTVPAYVQMNFDLPNGASKVTYWQGAYYTDAISTLRLEYSVDGGVTWVAAAPDVRAQSGGSRQETVLLDIKGKVRFRITKLGLGATSVPNVLNGRLCIEDIAVYSN